MLKEVLPPQQCRWCKNDLKAGEMFCQVCKGNRLVPSRWWPVMAASTLIAVCTSCVMGFLIVAIWIMEDVPAVGTPAVATSVPGRTADQTILPNPAVSAVSPGQTFTPNQHPTATLVLTSTEAAEAARTFVLEPTDTPTLEPTDTPTFEPTDTPTFEPTNTPTPEPTNTPTVIPANTETPVPTATSTAPPVLVPDPRFRADRTSISAGECTFLHWDIDGVKAVFLDGAGRPGHSTEEICPEYTHTFVLVAVMPDGYQQSYSLDIRVLGYLPLILNLFISDRSCDTEESYAAEISIWAQGGDGQYTYYRDDLTQYIGGPTETGMVYQLSWRTCGGAPGTIIVRSGDGQEARKRFWIEPPACCGKKD